MIGVDPGTCITWQISGPDAHLVTLLKDSIFRCTLANFMLTTSHVMLLQLCLHGLCSLSGGGGWEEVKDFRVRQNTEWLEQISAHTQSF